MVGMGGCGGSSSPTSSTPAPTPTATPAPNFSGTWTATLGNGRGSFTFVVSGNTVTSLNYAFSNSAASGGSSCSVLVTCPAGAICATPTTGTITGNTVTIARPPSYSGSGQFSSANAAAGGITYSITSSASLCDTTQTTTWTATKP
jgi:hypothetical protein